MSPGPQRVPDQTKSNPGSPVDGTSCPRCTYEDENGFYPANLSPRERCPPLCHLDRRVPGFPTKTTLTTPRTRLSLKKGAWHWSAPHYLPQEIRGSGETSVVTSLLGNVFSTELSWACGPRKVMKNASFSNHYLSNRYPFLVIPTEAKRSGGTRGSADLRGDVFPGSGQAACNIHFSGRS